jgi:hypothetical protein
MTPEAVFFLIFHGSCGQKSQILKFQLGLDRQVGGQGIEVGQKLRQVQVVFLGRLSQSIKQGVATEAGSGLIFML